MTDTHHCEIPYSTSKELRDDLAALQARGVKQLAVEGRMDDPVLAVELVDEAHRLGLSIDRLHISPAALPAAMAIHAALDVISLKTDMLFRSRTVLGSITLEQELEEPLPAESLDALRDLGIAHGVDLRAHVHFASVNGERMARLVCDLVGAGFSEVLLAFYCPHSDEVDLAALRDALAVFCTYPIAEDPALQFAGLPFCLLPAPAFRPLYRAMRNVLPIEARLFSQRDLLRQMRRTSHAFQAPCLGCRRRSACYALTAIADLPDYAAHLRPSIETSVVFVGASLTANDRVDLASEDLVFARPAAQDDVFFALLEGFRDILLIDGYFYHRYALTIFEILVALLEGVNVFGASSLGAIRAIELGAYGMRGQGYVHEVLSAQKVVQYHLVAQTYDSSDQPLSIPPIALHRFLEQAEVDHLVDAETRQRCMNLVEGLHFSELSFGRAFRAWEASETIRIETVRELAALFERLGADAFDVKRHDARALLETFRALIARGTYGHARVIARAESERVLALLRARFDVDRGSELALGWNTPLSPSATRRECSPDETLARLEAFFFGLGAVVADTSLLDKSSYVMINVIFVPFFFLDYGNAAGSGYGTSREEAMVAAYGEVLERIPCGTLRQSFTDRDTLQISAVPALHLPFYEALDQVTLRRFVDDGGTPVDRLYVSCTDLMNGRAHALPRHGARLPNSCGMAAGNSLLEAVLYGLLEVIEHDVIACYETVPLMRMLRHLNIEWSPGNAPEVDELIDELRVRGHRVHFLRLPNRYDIPTVICLFFDAEREILFSGQCARLDLGAAIAHSLHEALNGHFVSYFGSRDDRCELEQQGQSLSARLLEAVVGSPTQVILGASGPMAPLAQQVEDVFDRLRRAGLTRAFALDLGPNSGFGLAVAKVIVPGMSFRSAARRPPAFFDLCVETLALVARETGCQSHTPNVGATPERAFRRSLHRFFKA